MWFWKLAPADNGVTVPGSPVCEDNRVIHRGISLSLRRNLRASPVVLVRGEHQTRPAASCTRQPTAAQT